MPTVSELMSKKLKQTITNVENWGTAQPRSEFINLRWKGYNYLSYVPPGVGYLDRNNVIAARATGANALAIVPIRWMLTATDTTIPQIIITNDSVRQAVRDAKSLGMAVMLKPHVDVEDGTFRGNIAPTNWDTWFANYQAYIMEFAHMAAEEGVDALCIGTELRSASVGDRRANWEALVTAVRAVYLGPLTYTALCSDPMLYENDEFGWTCIWNRLYGDPIVDIASVSMYFPMTNKNEPTVDELVAAWTYNTDGRNLVQIMASWQSKHGLPVIFGEVGCSRILGANKTPGKSPTEYPGYPDVTISYTEQNNYAEALLKVWSTAASWFLGLFWWDFHTDDPANYFNVDGYPVADVFSEYFSRELLDTADDLLLTAPTASLPIGIKLGNMDLMSLLTPERTRTIRTNLTTQTYWAKFAEVTLTRQFSSALCELAFINGDHGAISANNALNSRGFLVIRVKQQAALGSEPILQMNLLSIVGAQASDFKAVMTVVSSSKTVIEFYVLNKSASDSYVFEKMLDSGLYTDRLQLNSDKIVASLPSGTVVTATLPDGQFSTLKSNGHDVTTKNGYAEDTYIKYDLASSYALSAATFTRVPFDAISVDSKNEWSATNHEFVVKEAGVYSVNAIMRFDTQTSGSNSSVRIGVFRVSGSVTDYPITNTSTSATTGIVTMQANAAIRLLGVGDKIFLEGYNSSGATISTNSTTILIARVN